jgi:hypothetical protein
MKKTILSLGVLLTSLLQAQTDVRISINHLYDTNPIAFNTTLTNNQQEEFEITRLEYYLTDITITHDGGQVTEASDAYLLVNAENETNVLIGNYPITNLESIEFGIGVPADVNHEDPSAYDASHALSPKIPSMHWGWASGYRFIAYEGNSGNNLGTLFQFHALGDDNFFKQTITTSGVTSGSTLTVALDADYLQALNNIPVFDGPIKHGGNYPECIQLLDNFKTSVFSVSSSAPVSISEHQGTDVNIYPNPVTNTFNVQLSDDLTDVVRYSIIDPLGKVVKQGGLVEGEPISTSELSNGVYFLEVQSGASSIAKQSFIVNK